MVGHSAQGGHHIIHPIQHGAGIAGDVGLALGAVDDEVLNADEIHVELDVGGEASAAQTDNAALLDGLQEGLTGVHRGRL